MDLVQILLRWMHIVAGITWIGLLYYFNWMNGHVAATMDGDTKKKVLPELLPRVLYWFRWGAAYTWVTGVLLLALVFYHTRIFVEDTSMIQPMSWAFVALTFLAVFVYDIIFKSIGAKQPVGVIVAFVLVCSVICLFKYYGQFSYQGYTIHLGAMFGTMMAFNVWFRIWPAQQRIIRAIKAGEAPNPADPAMAGLRSKHNTYMSVPLVWTMINQHSAAVPGILNIPGEALLMVAVALGWALVFFLYKKSAQVKGF